MIFYLEVLDHNKTGKVCERKETLPQNLLTITSTDLQKDTAPENVVVVIVVRDQL